MSIDNQIARLERIAPNIPPCRCCARELGIIEGMMHIQECISHGISLDSVAIHTRCIPKHWSNHSRGRSASRCKEFGRAWYISNCTQQKFNHKLV